MGTAPCTKRMLTGPHVPALRLPMYIHLKLGYLGVQNMFAVQFMLSQSISS